MKCMMFGNLITGIEKELALEDYKVHTVRNRVAVLAVILTAVLLAVVFNVGLSLVHTVSLATAASPAPGRMGIVFMEIMEYWKKSERFRRWSGLLL